MVHRPIPVLVLCAVLCAAPRAGMSDNPLGAKAPVIKHTPITLAVPGQPITIRAVVTDPSGPVKSVTLFTTTSRDAAPFKIPMQDVGAGTYLGTIPANLVGGGSKLSYYIEAVGGQDATAETPWYGIGFRAPPVAPVPVAAATNQRPAGATASEKSFWQEHKVLIGGLSAAALVGGGLLAANAGHGGGGGSSGGGGTGGSVTNAGTYVGSVTLCLALSGSAPACSSHSATFTVVSTGIISSDDLYPKQHLEGQLSGEDFELVANVADTNLTGQIHYIGVLFGSRLAGTVQGTATTTAGTPGTYSGTFGATKQ